MKQVFALWTSSADFARSIGVSDISVRAWKRRGIPAKHDPKIVNAARDLGWDLTLEKMAKLRAGECDIKILPIKSKVAE